MKPQTSTIVRVVLLVVALVNMALSTLGVVPEELVGDTQAYEIGSIIVTAILAVINTWENNSFTKEAMEADQYLEQLIAAKKTGTTTETKKEDETADSEDKTEE